MNLEASSTPVAQEALANDDSGLQEISGNLEPTDSAETLPSSSTSQSMSTSTPSIAASSSSSKRSVHRLKSAMARSLPNPAQNQITKELSNTRPSGLKFKPKSFIRRSKEEREADEKAEAERKTARQAAEGSSSVNDRGGYNGRGRGRGQRGGPAEMTRWKSERFNISHEASGHLGGSTISDTATSKNRRGGRASSGTLDPSEQGTTSGRSRIKKESAPRPEKDKDGDVIMGSSNSKPKRTKVKKEEHGPTYIPSENELDSDGEERVNIDDISTINLISSEEEDENGELILQSRSSTGKRRDVTPRGASNNLMPVRIQRQEHVERAVGVNTDASSLTSAELRRRAKKRADAEGSLFLPENEDADDFSLTKPKLKRKPKDVEFVRNERKWKGVYQDEDINDGKVKIKDEPKDDEDIVMAGTRTGDAVEPISLTDIDLANTQAQRTLRDSHGSLGSQASLKGSEEASEADTPQPGDRLPKIKGYHGLRPINYSEEEEEEEDDLLAEIAEIVLSKSEVLDNATSPQLACSMGASDDDSDLEIDNEDTYFRRGGREEVFLFQLPPFVPSLRDKSKPPSKIEDKKKNKAVSLDIPRSSASNASITSQVKDEPVIKADPDELSHEAALPHAYTSDSFHSSGGQGGALIVYAKGSMIATWGGMRFEIGKEGTGAKLLQELMVTDFERTVTKVEDESRWEEIVDVGKKGWAMGQTRPGHVCIPELLL